MKWMREPWDRTGHLPPQRKTSSGCSGHGCWNGWHLFCSPTDWSQWISLYVVSSMVAGYGQLNYVASCWSSTTEGASDVSPSHLFHFAYCTCRSFVVLGCFCACCFLFVFGSVSGSKSTSSTSMTLKPEAFESMSWGQYLHPIIPFHSFVTSIASDIPSKLELHLFDIHQATWGETEAIRCPKTRSGLQICWGYRPHPWTHNISTGCSHKDNTSHNSHVQFYELWRFYFSDRQTNKECAQHQPVNQLTGQPVKQQQPFKQVGTVTLIFWACW